MLSLARNYLKQNLIILIVLILAVIFYPKFMKKTEPEEKKDSSEIKLFTNEELIKYNGKDDGVPIYLSILGSVYDVTKGKKHYGIGCSYNFFAGRDASVSFVTGEFEEYTDRSNDILQLEPSELLSLYNWKKFYDTDYTYKGKLIGRFYDDNGDKTDYFRRADKLVEIAQNKKDDEEKRKQEFPPCNIEWSESTGTKVWCSTSSGGIEREWPGLPRKYFEPGQGTYRCACVNDVKINSPLLEPYENCDSSSDTCFYRV